MSCIKRDLHDLKIEQGEIGLYPIDTMFFWILWCSCGGGSNSHSSHPVGSWVAPSSSLGVLGSCPPRGGLSLRVGDIHTCDNHLWDSPGREIRVAGQGRDPFGSLSEGQGVGYGQDRDVDRRALSRAGCSFH